ILWADPTSYLVNSYSDVKEINEKQKESFEATWLDTVMETRPDQKTSLFENDSLKRETHEQKKWAHFVVRRNPDQSIRVGRLGGTMQKYQLPYKSILPLPIFVPTHVIPQRELKGSLELENETKFDRVSQSGICSMKREVSEITKDMPPIIRPTRQDFRASRA
uniref:Zmp:0000000930 n=1 Tax=Denticeps clupeoides TaxID=299321 RepID=A0AAY4CDV7_9TELE